MTVQPMAPWYRYPGTVTQKLFGSSEQEQWDTHQVKRLEEPWYAPSAAFFPAISALYNSWPMRAYFKGMVGFHMFSPFFGRLFYGEIWHEKSGRTKYYLYRSVNMSSLFDPKDATKNASTSISSRKKKQLPFNGCYKHTKQKNKNKNTLKRSQLGGTHPISHHILAGTLVVVTGPLDRGTEAMDLWRMGLLWSNRYLIW